MHGPAPGRAGRVRHSLVALGSALCSTLFFAWFLALSAALLPAPARAAALRYCDRPAELSAAQQDRLFRLAALVKDELEASGHAVALIARSGLDLQRFGVRYSHAGISLRDSPNTRWSVRQLYYACDEGQPRLFDQGMSGFVLGTENPEAGYLSLVLLPAPEAALLAAHALDKRQALGTLAPVYSANAYAFSTRYQNCNQWLAETLAAAWGGLAPGPGAALREQAQQWLLDQGYAPTRMEVGWPALVAAAPLIPWLHNDDHPEADLAQALYRVSMPASIEAFVQQRWPQARRIEICHAGGQAVIHEGWTPVAEGCVAGPGDRVLRLD